MAGGPLEARFRMPQEKKKMPPRVVHPRNSNNRKRGVVAMLNLPEKLSTYVVNLLGLCTFQRV